MRTEEEIRAAIKLAVDSYMTSENEKDRQRAEGRWFALRWVLNDKGEK